MVTKYTFTVFVTEYKVDGMFQAVARHIGGDEFVGYGVTKPQAMAAALDAISAAIKNSGR